jgi:hypothetical protein
MKPRESYCCTSVGAHYEVIVGGTIPKNERVDLPPPQTVASRIGGLSSEVTHLGSVKARRCCTEPHRE